jgi:type I restriction enzyme R subunit
LRYDFVRAHHHFNDPEWDGEPAEPEPVKAPKARLIQSMTGTTFWSAGGRPMSAAQFRFD